MAKRHTEEQIIGVLKESEAGMNTSELCRTHGISTGTFYKWKDKYGGLTISEARRLRVQPEKSFLRASSLVI